MSKIVFSNAWSYYNKGDASIALATVNAIHEILPDAEKTLLAVDHQSFVNNSESFNCKLKILPMVHTIPPFNRIFTLYSAISRYNSALTSFFGIIYLILQVSLFSFIRRKKSVLDNILTEIETADVIVAIGGNYLYSNKSFFNHILILIYGKFVKKKKIILLGHSIGPFNDVISSYLAKKILNHMDYILFRESLSDTYIKDNITKQIVSKISGDAAFLIPSPNTSNEYREPRIIAISIRKWFFRSPDKFQKYLVTMIKIIVALVKNNYRIYLIPFSYVGTAENDLELCNLVLMKLPDQIKNQVTILNIKNLSPYEIGDLMNELKIDALIATRLHSAILASIYNIPCIVISYQYFKGFGISKQIGLDDYVINIADINYDHLYTMLNNLLKNSKNIKKRLTISVRKMRQKTLNDYTLTIKRII